MHHTYSATRQPSTVPQQPNMGLQQWAGLQGPPISSISRPPFGPRLPGTILSQTSESNNHTPRPPVFLRIDDGNAPPSWALYYPETTPGLPATGGVSRLSLHPGQPGRTTNPLRFDNLDALAEAQRELRQLPSAPPQSSSFRAPPLNSSAASGLPNDSVDATDGGSTSSLNPHTSDWGNIRGTQVAQNRHILQMTRADHTSVSVEDGGQSSVPPRNIRSPVDDPTLYSDGVESTAQPKSDKGDGEEDEDVYHTDSDRDESPEQDLRR